MTGGKPGRTSNRKGRSLQPHQKGFVATLHDIRNLVNGAFVFIAFGPSLIGVRDALAGADKLGNEDHLLVVAGKLHLQSVLWIVHHLRIGHDDDDGRF